VREALWFVPLGLIILAAAIGIAIGYLRSGRNDALAHMVKRIGIRRAKRYRILLFCMPVLYFLALWQTRHELVAMRVAIALVGACFVGYYYVYGVKLRDRQ
jgi:hypothetical protein